MTNEERARQLRERIAAQRRGEVPPPAVTAEEALSAIRPSEEDGEIQHLSGFFADELPKVPEESRRGGWFLLSVLSFLTLGVYAALCGICGFVGLFLGLAYSEENGYFCRDGVCEFYREPAIISDFLGKDYSGLFEPSIAAGILLGLAFFVANPFKRSFFGMIFAWIIGCIPVGIAVGGFVAISKANVQPLITQAIRPFAATMLGVIVLLTLVSLLFSLAQRPKPGGA